ncbi:uncharacterized protein LOC135389432 [Ornithodoros turicata]|uniref:uncharacterized protein LOC135389432 n=1 Tax=Ornithodoros turicata TaxID=34597 RepID=UPI003139BE4F
MRQPISIEKRVAIGLYRLCSTAEDSTIAYLFGVGRSTVNVVYRQFAKAVIQDLEDEWLRMVSPGEMGEHIREFYAVSGFPQGVGALDGCHFAVSPPKNNAVDYYNYKGCHVTAQICAIVEDRKSDVPSHSISGSGVSRLRESGAELPVADCRYVF